MAISITNPGVGSWGIHICATSADVSGCETLLAPTVGKSLHISHITLNSTAAISLTIGEGAAAGTIDTILLGPIAFPALGTMQWNFGNGGMKLTENLYLLIDGDAGQICAYIAGRVF